MVMEWLRTDTGASWEKLRSALIKTNNNVVADRILAEYLGGVESQTMPEDIERGMIHIR